ncbi:MAG: CBS domain-containing protein [Gammaproteobacteria bacterium]|jgi:CBS domain-containing protein
MTTATDVRVSDIMQRDVLSVEEDWSLNRLARFLTDNAISGAPVTSSAGDLAGVVSLTDIVRYDSTPEHRARERHTHEYYLHSLEMQVAAEEASTFHIEQESQAKVRDIMTPMVFAVAEDASVQEAADMMVKGRIHRLIVTRDSRIAGIVTALDLLDLLR